MIGVRVGDRRPVRLAVQGIHVDPERAGDGDSVADSADGRGLFIQLFFHGSGPPGTR
ncbi:MAG: hypothetical protein ACT4NY_29020 [Pseudonocardiales bacterium]